MTTAGDAGKPGRGLDNVCTVERADPAKHSTTGRSSPCSGSSYWRDQRHKTVGRFAFCELGCDASSVRPTNRRAADQYLAPPFIGADPQLTWWRYMADVTSTFYEWPCDLNAFNGRRARCWRHAPSLRRYAPAQYWLLAYCVVILDIRYQAYDSATCPASGASAWGLHRAL